MMPFSTGRLHRMLIPYPVTTTSDGRPITNTNSLPGMENKRRQQQKSQVDQSNQLSPTASNGATGTATPSHTFPYSP